MTSYFTIWLSVDPLASKYPSLSPYVYCADNPVRFIDPDGRSIGDYWRYNSANNKMEHAGHDGKSDGKHYVQVSGGNISVTPENFDKGNIMNNFALLPSNETREVIGKQYDAMKSGFKTIFVDSKKVTGTFYEKGGFQVSNSEGNSRPVLAPDGNPVEPKSFSGFSKTPGIDPMPLQLLLEQSQNGYSNPDIVWHLHPSALIDNNRFGTIGGSFMDNLWGTGPSGSDLFNAANGYCKDRLNVSTLLQIDTHGNGQVNFYNNAGIYFSMPLKTFREPLQSTQ